MSDCNVKDCSNGWIAVVEILDLTYEVTTNADGRKTRSPKGKTVLEHRRMMKYLDDTELGYEALWAHVEKRDIDGQPLPAQIAHEAVIPCPSCKPDWVHPHKRRNIDAEVERRGKDFDNDVIISTGRRSGS